MQTESIPAEGQRILVLPSQPSASSQGAEYQPAGREGLVTKFKKGRLMGIGASTHTVLFDSGGTETLVLRHHGNGGLDFRVLDSEEVRGLKQEVGDLTQEVCDLKQKVDNLQGATSSQEATGSGPEVQGSPTSAPTPLAESKIVPILLDEIDRLSGRSSPSEGLEARLAGALRTQLKHAQLSRRTEPAAQYSPTSQQAPCPTRGPACGRGKLCDSEGGGKDHLAPSSIMALRSLTTSSSAWTSASLRRTASQPGLATHGRRVRPTAGGAYT